MSQSPSADDSVRSLLLQHPIAFGTYRLRRTVCRASVLYALKCGYRVLDCAILYKNHDAVGEALKKAFASGICSREDIVLISKIPEREQAFDLDSLQTIVKKLCDELGVNHVDVLLLHSYSPTHWKQAWLNLETIRHRGFATTIGVSNFYAREIKQLMQLTERTCVPILNQIELTPYHYPRETIALCENFDILVQSHSPLVKGEVFDDPSLLTLCETASLTPAQILLVGFGAIVFCLRFAQRIAGILRTTFNLENHWMQK
jgi:diketogulonate reductase-like aldo/keto reductase